MEVINTLPFMLGKFLAFDLYFWSSLIMNNLHWLFFLLFAYYIISNKASLFPGFIYFIAFNYAFVFLMDIWQYPWFSSLFPIISIVFLLSLGFFTEKTRFEKHFVFILVFAFFLFGWLFS
ncbi:MAG TPA: hypothetical protein VJK05_02455 [archaeon]|nr:hypothetical protein [archaeon]